MIQEINKLKIGIPKGSLQENTIKVFDSAGFYIKIMGKSYVLGINDPEIDCYLLRPQEIPKYVQEGKLDLGISGDDWIAETKAKVTEVCDLEYAKQKIKKIKWVLAVPESSALKSIKDLSGKIISTEIVNVAKDYLKKNKIKAKVKFSFGATEVKPPMFADAIIDLVETGSALLAHNLKVLDIVMESSTKMFANKKSLKNPWKKEKIKEISVLLKGVVESQRMVGIFAHAPKEILEKALKVLPSSKKTTITRVSGTDFYDIFTVSLIENARTLLPKLKRMGCHDIVEFPLNKMIV